MSNEEREKHADIVISNDGTLEELKETVRSLWHLKVNGGNHDSK
jgi:dephospho-CoA kinase